MALPQAEVSHAARQGLSVDLETVLNKLKLCVVFSLLRFVAAVIFVHLKEYVMLQSKK